MKKIFLILFSFFIFLFFIPFFHQKSFSKYTFDYSFTAFKIVIDKKPEISVLSVGNNNISYEKYANKSHTISLNVKITEKNIAINNFNSNFIKIMIGNQYTSPSMKISLISNTSNELIYNIILTNLTGNGNLYVVFPEGTIQDISNQNNEFQKFDTSILIDNIAPTLSCNELSIEDNKSNYVINSNESIRPVENWSTINNNSISKIFLSPIKYPISIYDYAGNKSEVFVNIKNAKNIVLYYLNYNNYSISEFNKSGEISGKKVITENTIYKTEFIHIFLDGAIDKSALQARIYDYTYWGENTSATCFYSEINYSYGYNPSPNSWYNINSRNALYSLGKLCFQVGGQGQNSYNNSCKGSNTPIPKNIADQYLYGISGISLKLNNYDNLSIVYQIYVSGIGWLRASSDGEETTYSHTKPFSAIRMNIVPKSEKNQLLNYWNTFIGASNTD